jgi:arylsulfatase A-like enzyme
MHGRSVVPLVWSPRNPEDHPKWRDAWLYEYFEFPDVSHNVNKHRGVRTEKWKYIHYFDPPFKFKEEFELYDLEKDPEERVNLANRPMMQAMVKELRAKMEQLRKETGEIEGK